MKIALDVLARGSLSLEVILIKSSYRQSHRKLNHNIPIIIVFHKFMFFHFIFTLDIFRKML